MIGKAISDLMIKPGKSPVFDSPENYGLDYENVSFKAKDGEELYGWIIKGSNNKVIIQSHLGFSVLDVVTPLRGKTLSLSHYGVPISNFLIKPNI